MKMKHGWIYLLLLSILVTGCNASNTSQGKKNEKTATSQSKKNEKTAKTQSKATKQKRPARSVAIQKLDDSKMNIVIFLNRAEHVVEDVYYAAIDHTKGKTAHEDGITYLELPKRFDSKDKVIAYFSKFWSRSLSEALYDNLSTKQIKNKLYVAIPNVDYPVLISVRNTAVEKLNSEIRVSVQNVTDPAFSSDRTLRYQLMRDDKTKRYEIKSRMGTYGNDQFQ
ncbi:MULTISPECIES: DL-endopeptidase inhibitor IseA family protein [Brevibacillus]|uniref:Uncharacterized protein n=1 Tax=Brevibacillus invocatus TaxID=173959 RepID=A0A3M8CI86_9BACL|nr:MULTISPECIES: DL-endopeptidase inhibitor IseA family protein [Brevibacillus]MCM3078783.1 IseA DL-endopeptidase inhibitor family protein [Brevibacillus invocatus]MCM3428871.1 IseA DL-endopeptidase inhibitor family protein [Brevibacillus invocatus]MDH4616359.1 hypothetical protein [Brevibacillus sp. AY1]RNB74555.1 hypothetical protein EDM52_09855 [Brevibacillus invocatus]